MKKNINGKEYNIESEVNLSDADLSGADLNLENLIAALGIIIID